MGSGLRNFVIGVGVGAGLDALFGRELGKDYTVDDMAAVSIMSGAFIFGYEKIVGKLSTPDAITGGLAFGTGLFLGKATYYMVKYT